MKSLGILKYTVREKVLTFFASIVGGNSGMAHQDSLLIFLAWSQQKYIYSITKSKQNAYQVVPMVSIHVLQVQQKQQQCKRTSQTRQAPSDGQNRVGTTDDERTRVSSCRRAIILRTTEQCASYFACSSMCNLPTL